MFDTGFTFPFKCWCKIDFKIKLGFIGLLLLLLIFLGVGVGTGVTQAGFRKIRTRSNLAVHPLELSQTNKPLFLFFFYFPFIPFPFYTNLFFLFSLYSFNQITLFNFSTLLSHSNSHPFLILCIIPSIIIIPHIYFFPSYVSSIAILDLYQLLHLSYTSSF